MVIQQWNSPTNINDIQPYFVSGKFRRFDFAKQLPSPPLASRIETSHDNLR